MVLAQLYVPTKMILDKEKIISEGTVFRFKTAPMDPTDPFRGKYVRLRFEDLSVDIDTSGNWSYNEKGYAILDTDDEGFVYAKKVSKVEPTETRDYLQTEVRIRKRSGVSKLLIDCLLYTSPSPRD